MKLCSGADICFVTTFNNCRKLQLQDNIGRDG